MNTPDIADLPEEYSPLDPKKRPKGTFDSWMKDAAAYGAAGMPLTATSCRLQAEIVAKYEAEDARKEALAKAVRVITNGQAYFVMDTLTVRAPYFQKQLEAVKVDSASPSSQTVPVAAPKPIHRHWSDAPARPVGRGESLSLPRAWEMRK
jgi:hypothetical protein